MKFRVDSEDERAFRLEVRDWLEANAPDELKNRITRPTPDALHRWQRKLHRRGWVAPHWPREVGGMGATLYQQLILTEEMIRVGVPMLITVGFNFVGPIIANFGTEAQKADHLPRILRAEVEWAQGYSEPNAGSDLAAVKTTARLDGDHFVVNGNKIWQTWGHHAQWMFALVRTDSGAAKHRGLSCLIIDLDTPGITVRPILNLAGEDEVSEFFFDDVWVPADNLVGEMNGGWRLANSLLAHERLAGSNPQFSIAAMERTRRVALTTGLWEDAGFRDRFAALEIDLAALSALFWQAVECRESGREPAAETSLCKVQATVTVQRVADLLMEAAGAHGAEWQTRCDGEMSDEVVELFLQSRRATIFGGALEIQKNIISRRLLDLPDWRGPG